MRSLMTHDVSQAAASMQPTTLLELFSRHLRSVKNHLLFPSFPPFLLLRNPSRTNSFFLPSSTIFFEESFEILDISLACFFLCFFFGIFWKTRNRSSMILSLENNRYVLLKRILIDSIEIFARILKNN